MQIKIAPSILSADFSAVGEAVKNLEKCGADLIHCDVMDGSFVGPITFGGQMIKNIRPLTKLPLDVHLMIEHPKTQIKFFADAGADIITVHYRLFTGNARTHQIPRRKVRRGRQSRRSRGKNIPRVSALRYDSLNVRVPRLRRTEVHSRSAR